MADTDMLVRTDRELAQPAPCPGAAGWRCRAAKDLHIRAWHGDSAAVVFDDATGQTHGLATLAAHLLLALRAQGPLGVADAITALSAADTAVANAAGIGAPAPADADALLACLHSLAALRLIEPVTLR